MFFKKDIENIYTKINKLTNVFNINEIGLCHHDIHSGNIIQNEKLNLIDLEFSFNDFIYVDLGNIICEYFTDYQKEIYNFDLINEKIKEDVLKSYNLKVNEIGLNKLNIGINISHFYWLVWGILVDFKEKKDGFNYIKFARCRYKYLLEKV